MRTNHVPTLTEVLDELRREIARLENRHQPTSRLTKKRVTLNLVLQQYRDVALILARIVEAKERARQAQAALTKGPTTGPITDPILLGQFQECMDSTQFLRFDIKALYVWCYHVKDVFQKRGVRIDLAELNRISLIRNQFITHTATTPLWETVTWAGGLLADKEYENIRLLFHSMDLNKASHRGLPALVKKTTQYIPELASTPNKIEQMDLIYRDYNKLVGRELKKEVARIIETSGVSTEAPAKLATALLHALREYRKLYRL